MIDQVESIPGRVYPVEAGALQPVPLGNVPADAFNERINIKNEIRETTASDQVVRGVSQEGQTTATEIVNQINQAGQRFGVKISQIENEGYYDLAKICLKMVQLFVTEPMAVKIIGQEQGIDWIAFDPSNFQGEYEPHVQLESTTEAKKQNEAAKNQELYPCGS